MAELEWRLEWHCERCDAAYPLDEIRYACECAYAGRLDLRRPPGPLRRPSEVQAVGTGIWRYAALLPLPADNPAASHLCRAFPAGDTPMIAADRLAASLGLAELWIKNEAANPTGSLKDRASALVVAAARHHGFSVIATASSGNAGAALAGAAAAAGLDCVVFLPARASEARRAQLLAYGARVLVVDGDYTAAVKLSGAACQRWGWWCRTSAVNPFTTQGKKTVALEAMEQLRWSAPDAVVVPAGDGNILVGVHRGLRDAYAAGWIDRIPRVIGVQAAAAPAIHRAWLSGATEVEPAEAATVADGISVGWPLDGHRALAAVRDTGGAFVTVGEDEILGAQVRLARDVGLIAEASSAAAVAALPDLRAAGLLAAGERVLMFNTGRGAATGVAASGDAPTIPADLAAVERTVPDLCVPGRWTGLTTGLSVISGT